MQLNNKLLNLLVLLFAVTFIALVGCEKSGNKTEKKTNAGNAYILNGTVTNFEGGKLTLNQIDKEKLIKKDSATVRDGKFEIKTYAPEADFYILKFNDSLGQLVILDKEKITIHADARNVTNTFHVNGANATADYVNFNKKILPYLQIENKIKSFAPDLIKRNNLDSLQLLQTMLENAQTQTKDFTKSYIDSIIPSLAVFNLLSFLNVEKDFNYLTETAQLLKVKLPESKYTKMLVGEISRMESMHKALDQNGAAIGGFAPDIALPDPNGKITSLSSLKGKFVLLDFWASWCGPCRAENPNVVKIYEKYKNKNFDVFSVSLDKDKSPWLAAIKRDGLVWHHVSDLKFWNSPVVSLYGIEGIPATFLLDKEGKIIAKNLRGKALEDKIESLLK